MAEVEHSTSKPINLTRDFVGASAHGAGQLAENDDFTLSNSDRHLLHAAVAAENGDGSSFMLPGAQQGDEANPNSNAGKRRRDERQQTHLTLMEQARQLSERLGQQVAAMEASFEAEMGDAWREQIANKVMDPDAIPQRRSGESMQEYRERLELGLIATMIDSATGEIKPEYANSDDPDIQRYAQWAQAQHRKNRIDSAPESELAAILESSRDLDDIRNADFTLETRDGGIASPLEEVDRQREQSASAASQENQAFGI